MIGRRSLLLAGVALPVAARAQCVTDALTVDACLGGVRISGPVPSLDLSFLAAPLDPRITFTRASVATYFDVAGVLQTATTNTPRFDYDPVTHAPRGLLIEEQRINVLLNSATLGTQSVAVTAQAYTLSFYGTGTVTLTGTSTAGPLVGTGAFPTRVALTFTPTAGTLTLTVTGSVLNAQLEAGAFSTTWVPTTAAAVTRAADVATMPTAAWFSATQYTLASDAMFSANIGSFGGLASLNSGGGTNRLQLAAINLSPRTTVSSGGVNSVVNPETATVPVGTAFKFAGSLTTGMYMSSLNGAVPYQNSTAIVMPVGVTTLGLGALTGANFLNGWLQRVRYWPRALTAAELQQVTR